MLFRMCSTRFTNNSPPGGASDLSTAVLATIYFGTLLSLGSRLRHKYKEYKQWLSFCHVWMFRFHQKKNSTQAHLLCLNFNRRGHGAALLDTDAIASSDGSWVDIKLGLLVASLFTFECPPLCLLFVAKLREQLCVGLGVRWA